jgi:nucleoside-diphosphate-sugar epimerase
MTVNGVVLLTGATGHVGFATLKALLQHGYTVHAAVRSEAKASLVRSALAGRVEEGQLEFIIVPDFLQDGAFDKAAKGMKYIVHVASPLPSNASEGDDLEEALVKPAVQGTLGVFESAQKAGTVQRIVVTSSNAATVPLAVLMGQDDGQIYGPDYRSDYLEAPYMNQPAVGYVASKIAALKRAEEYIATRKPGFDAIHIHPSYVEGRNELTTTIKDFELGTNAFILAPVLGRTTKDPKAPSVVHVDDVALAHVLALDPKIQGNQSFLLASSGQDNMQWNDAKEFVKKHFPDAVQKGLLPNNGSAPTSSGKADNSKTKQLLGIDLQGYETMVISVIGHYLEVLKMEEDGSKTEQLLL